MRALWLRSVESSVRIKNIMEYISIAELWFPYDRMIAEDRTWFYLLRSSANVCDRRSVFPYDCRRLQNFLRSAIIWKPALRYFSAFTKLRFLTYIVSCGSKTTKLVKAMKQAFSLTIIINEFISSLLRVQF